MRMSVDFKKFTDILQIYKNSEPAVGGCAGRWILKKFTDILQIYGNSNRRTVTLFCPSLL